LASYSGDELVVIYRYFRSLAVDNPFTTARENLIVAFEKVMRPCVYSRDVPLFRPKCLKLLLSSLYFLFHCFPHIMDISISISACVLIYYYEYEIHSILLLVSYNCAGYTFQIMFLLVLNIMHTCLGLMKRAALRKPVCLFGMDHIGA
jgi:hypothetical protein